jgi:hypothetical protein
MGKNNRERRAAKKKVRDRVHREREESSAAPSTPPSAPPTLDAAVDALARAARAFAAAGGDPAEHTLELTGGELGVRPQLVDAAVDLVTRTALASVWRSGWLPYDVARLVQRRLGAQALTLVTDLIAAQVAEYAAATVHERWQEQLTQIDAGVWWRADAALLGQWQVRHRCDRIKALALVVEFLAMTLELPPLPVILPLPGTAHAASGAHHSAVDPKILGRVRGLLAKAESTQFPEEAEALSAKAQELMTRHAFERALLDAETHVSQAAASRRIWLDAPYIGAKAQLVNSVADANRCKVVVYEKLGFVAVLGDELDLDITELLSTSLLVQATRALVATDRDSGRTGQVRNYRQSFLLAYATRIGQRLAETNEPAVADDRLLPVLADRSKAVEALFREMFPRTVNKSYAVRSEAGWGAGTSAADRADLGLDRTAVSAGERRN